MRGLLFSGLCQAKRRSSCNNARKGHVLLPCHGVSFATDSCWARTNGGPADRRRRPPPRSRHAVPIGYCDVVMSLQWLIRPGARQLATGAIILTVTRKLIFCVHYRLAWCTMQVASWIQRPFPCSSSCRIAASRSESQAGLSRDPYIRILIKAIYLRVYHFR